MRYLWLLLTVLAFIVLAPAHAHAQQGNTVTIRFPGAPTGSCSPVSYAVNNATGALYDCKTGSWNLVGGGGGGTCPQGTCVVNAPTSDQVVTGAHALIFGSGGRILGGNDLTGTVTYTDDCNTSTLAQQILDGTGIPIIQVALVTGGNTTVHDVVCMDSQLGQTFMPWTYGAGGNSTGIGSFDTIVAAQTFLDVYDAGNNAVMYIHPDANLYGDQGVVAYHLAPSLIFPSIAFSAPGNVPTFEFADSNGDTPGAPSGTVRANKLISLNSTTAGSFLTSTNCSSSASPAVCSSAAAGSVVIAAGATTVVVNTTAVTANSQILVFPDETLGTKLSVTCNSTLATAAAGLAITARTAGTSFTISTLATVAVNPVCLSYAIIN